MDGFSINKQAVFLGKCYRDEPGVGRCIESILNQTYPQFLFYLIYGENTKEIVEAYAKKDKRLIPRFFSEKDRDNDFYQVLEEIKNLDASYYCWVDGDDWYEREFLEKMIPFYEENHLDMAVCGYQNMNIKGEKLNQILPPKEMVCDVRDMSRWLIEEWPLVTSTWGILYNKALLKTIDKTTRPGVEEHGGHGADTMFNFAFLPLAKRIGFKRECLYNYQQTENSNTYTLRPGRIKSAATELEYILSSMEKMGNRDMVNVYFLYTQYGCWVLENLNLVLLSQESKENKYEAAKYLFSHPYTCRLYEMMKKNRQDQFQRMYLSSLLQQRSVFSDEKLCELIQLLYPELSFGEIMLRLGGKEKGTKEVMDKSTIKDFIEAGKFKEAEEAAGKYLKQYPLDAEIAIFKATAEQEQGKIKEAEATIKAGLACDSQNYELYFMLGNLHWGEGDYPLAAQCYAQAYGYCSVEKDKNLIWDCQQRLQLEYMQFFMEKIRVLEEENQDLKNQLKLQENVQQQTTRDFMELSRNLFSRCENMKYELLDQKIKEKLFFPRIVSAEETLERLIKERKSIARFGDGELSLLLGMTRQKFQEKDSHLVERLKEVLNSREANLLIGLANCYGNLEDFTDEAADGCRCYMIDKVRKGLEEILDKDRLYYDAYVTRPYVLYRDRFTAAPGKRFAHFKKLWKNRNIIIIEGAQTRAGAGNDLFQEAASIRRILAPATNSFRRYEEIYREAINHGEEDTLFLIALGPTAGVLAYDLTRKGYQAVDMGHLDLEYEWFLAGKGIRTCVPYKYNNEVAGGDKVADIHDPVYESQILAAFL